MLSMYHPFVAGVVVGSIAVGDDGPDGWIEEYANGFIFIVILSPGTLYTNHRLYATEAAARTSAQKVAGGLEAE